MIDLTRQLTKEELFDTEVFATIIDTESEVEKLELKEYFIEEAKRLGQEKRFKEHLKAYEKDNENANKPISFNFVSFELERNDKGAVKNTVNNYLTIFRNDERFKDKLFFNELSSGVEKKIGETMKSWTDVDDSKTKCYIEKAYGIYSEKKIFDALNIAFYSNSYNPVINIIEGIEWDGKPRMKNLLTKWLKVEDSEYTREVSRLIFAGGIYRLYEPGCKFDDMPVLIGTKQGEGKSSFVSWLALEEDYFREVKDIEGQKGIEILQGAWICEVAELLALTKTKEVEAVKSYITCRNDTYRKPYERRLTSNPRRCIFIGTTNKERFLTDKTGNRRFYPVVVNSTGYELYKHKSEIMEDIRQCWAEAFYLYRKGELKQCADESLASIIRQKQSEAVEEDYRETLIEDFLQDKNSTCVMEIWQLALGHTIVEPKPKEQSDITVMLRNLGWKAVGKPKRFKSLGNKLYKYWEREMPF